MPDEDPLKHGAEEHPRPSDHPDDQYGRTGAKKVPNDKRKATDPVVGFDRPPVRSRTGDVQ